MSTDRKSSRRPGRAAVGKAPAGIRRTEIRTGLKVLYSFPGRLGTGAVGLAAVQTIRLLKAAGHDVEVVCGAGTKSIEGIPSNESRRVFGLYLPHKIVGPTVLRSLHDRVVSNRIRTAKMKPDILHVWPMSGLRSLAEAKKAGVLIVREAPNCNIGYGLDVVAREHARLGVPTCGSHKPNSNKLALERAEYEAADVILVPSSFAKTSFENEGVPADKLELHRYGFDPSIYTGWTRTNATAPVVFGFVASCEPRKGLHLALQAWHASGVADESRFLVVGSFVPGYFKVLSSMLKHPNVKTVGYVNNLVPIYQEIDALVLPSIEDGSALVTYESQAMSCALLVSQASGAIITDGVEGFMHNVGDVETLASQMRRLVRDRQLLKGLQTAARENSINITWEQAVDHLIDIYRCRLSYRYNHRLDAAFQQDRQGESIAEVLQNGS